MGRSKQRVASAGVSARKEFALGVVLGAVLYVALYALRVQKAFLEFDHRWGILPFALVIGFIYRTRLRWLVWSLAAATAIVFVIAVMTPIVPRSARALIRTDPLRKADAVVVLGSNVTRERKLDFVAYIRMVDGLHLVREGWAPVLVWTVVGGDVPRPDEDVRRLVKLCGDPSVVPVGPVLSTRDEAVRVATLAQEKGWRRIILVTSPYHSARARAVFSKLDLEVISRPCVEREFAPTDPRSTRERLEIFRWWLYEQVRWFLYRVRGWV